jgi:hypothetical protein
LPLAVFRRQAGKAGVEDQPSDAKSRERRQERRDAAEATVERRKGWQSVTCFRRLSVKQDDPGDLFGIATREEPHVLRARRMTVSASANEGCPENHKEERRPHSTERVDDRIAWREGKKSNASKSRKAVRAAPPIAGYASSRVSRALRATPNAPSHDDSRWYSGIGIHRDTWIIVKELVHAALDGVKITTPDVDAERAVVTIATTVQNDSINTQTVSVATDIRAVNGTAVASDTTPATLLPGERAVVRQRLYVDAPSLWSVDRPPSIPRRLSCAPPRTCWMRSGRGLAFARCSSIPSTASA